MDMFLILLVPSPCATGIAMAFWPLVIYLAPMYSALGCMIIDTGAMGSCKVLETSNTNLMEHYELYIELLKQCGTFNGMEMPISLQYCLAESLQKSTWDLEAGLSWEEKDKEGSKEW